MRADNEASFAKNESAIDRLRTDNEKAVGGLRTDMEKALGEFRTTTERRSRILLLEVACGWRCCCYHKFHIQLTPVSDVAKTDGIFWGMVGEIRQERDVEKPAITAIISTS